MNEKGYSLVELVLATLITVSLLAVLGGLLSKFNHIFSQAEEVSQKNNDVEFASRLLKQDFENLGGNLTKQVNEPLAGKVVQPFYPNSDYSISPDLLRNFAGTNSFLRSLIGFRGTSRITGKCADCTFDFVEGDLGNLQNVSQFYALDTPGNGGVGSQTVNGLTHRIVKFQSENASLPLPFEITFHRVLNNSQSNCLATINYNNSTQAQIEVGCSNFQTFGLKSSGEIRNFELQSGEISFFPNSLGKPFLSVPLPVNSVRNSRPDPFLSFGSIGFMLFAGSKDSPKILQNDVRPHLGAQFSIALDNAESLKEGDYLLLTDFVNQRSVLLQIQDISGSELQVNRIDNPTSSGGYSDFYSPSGDFFDTNQGLPFLFGSRVVKLEAIEYRVNNLEGSEQQALFRRRVGTDWELVLPNIQNLSVIPNFSSHLTSFQISLEVATEGIENNQSTQKVLLNISPRPLNPIYEVQ